MKYTLVPVELGRESLRRISLDSENPSEQKVMLGRNAPTGLDKGGHHSINVSREHAEVFFAGTQLYLKAVSRQDKIVSLNYVECSRETYPLKDGDVISLIGALKFYNYQVQKVTEVAKSSSYTPRAPLPAVNATSNSHQNAIILDDDEAPVYKKPRVESGSREVINLEDSAGDLWSSTASSAKSGKGKTGDIISLLSSSFDSNASRGVMQKDAARKWTDDDVIEIIDQQSFPTTSSNTNRNSSGSNQPFTVSRSSSLPTPHKIIPGQPLGVLAANAGLVVVPPAITITTAHSTATTANTAAAAAAAAPEVPPTPKMSEVLQSLLRQYECSICYETMACAVSLTPCGDTFCFTCISEWATHNQSCPSCNSTFDLLNSIPSRVTDNAVREILKEEKEELAQWEERTNVGTQARRKQLQAPPAKTSSSTAPVASVTAFATNAAPHVAPIMAPVPAAAAQNAQIAHYRDTFVNVSRVPPTSQYFGPSLSTSYRNKVPKRK